MSNFNFGTSYLDFFFGNISGTLETVNLSNANTSRVTSMTYMFDGCSKLERVNLTGIDTSSVTDFQAAFRGCSSLITLDLSSFNTSNVTSMRDMFKYASSLVTIYASNLWTTASLTEAGRKDMFWGCSSLRGGGSPPTTYSRLQAYYDRTHDDYIYARIDGGANSATPGYFTLKTN